MLRGDGFNRDHLFWWAGTAALAMGLSMATPSGALAQECAPPCRAGFMCHKGQCVSVCNPPCEAGERCTAEGECVPRQAEAPAPQAQPAPYGQPAPHGQPAPYGQPAPHDPSAPGQPAPAQQPGGWGAPPPQQTQGTWGAPAQPSGPPPPQLDLRDKTQFYGGLHLRFGGEVSTEDFSGGWPLDPAIGFFGGLDIGVSDYLALGPRFAFSAWRPDGASDRWLDLDVGFSLRPRIPISAGGAYIEVYAAIVSGFTAGFVSDLDKSFTPGFHVGVLPGIRAFFTDSFGILFEMGFMHHGTWWRTEDFFGDVEGTRTARNQGVMNMGIVTAF
jgi:hypothetical protein